MTPRPVMLSIATLGLAVVLASGAVAATKAKKPKRITQQATIGASVPCRGDSQFPCGPVYFEGYYLGDDPDPFIRAMIQRDLGAKFGDPD